MTTESLTFLQRLCRGLVRALYRDVEVRVDLADSRSGPELVVANHFGGFADAVVLLAVLPRAPRIIARDVIWRVPIIGWLMRRLRAIPVHKRADGAGDNTAMFSTCFDALAAGDSLLLFPEGMTRNDPSIGRVKTGAARIALGATEAGVADVRLTPVGIHYEDKAVLRSRVSVHVGRPLPVSASDVRGLTGEVDQALRSVAPDFQNWEEARALTAGSTVALGGNPSGHVSIAERDRLASILGDRGPTARRAIVDAVGWYERSLAEERVDDAGVAHPVVGRALAKRLVWDVLLTLVLFPLAVVGAVVSALPALIVTLVGRLRLAASVQATLKPITALVAFAILWLVVAWSVGHAIGPAGWLATLLLMPVYLVAMILVVERALELRRVFRSWRHARRPQLVRSRVLDERRAVIESVAESFAR